MTPVQLNRIGRKLYGEAWGGREGKERMAAELSRSPSTIYEWLAGTSGISKTVADKLKELVKQKQGA